MPHIDLDTMDDILANLLRKATHDEARTKLRNLHETCKDLARSGARLTVPGVVAKYGRQFKEPKESMSESSIRNKRNDTNPYNQLYRAWDHAAKARIDTKRSPGEPISPDELASIHPEPLRHRVGLMMAEARSLRSQVLILERVRDDQSIRVEGRDAANVVCAPASGGGLDEVDLDAVRDFLDPRKLKTRALVVTPDGGLTATVTEGVHRIADPGFVNALRNVVKDGR